MRRKLEELSGTLTEFVDQTAHLTLVIGADDASMPLIIKTLEALDQRNGADLFLIFAEDAVSPDAYLTSIAVRLEAQRMIANDALAKEGKPTWPELPVALLNPRVAPRDRLIAGITYVRARMPDDGGHRIVWALLPIGVRDRAGFAQIVGQLLPRDAIEPWMRGVRFIVRDDRITPFLIPSVRQMKAPGVLLCAPDFSTAAESTPSDEALAPTSPMRERMQALLQRAGLDYTYQRFPEAIEKYRILCAYFAEHDAKAMRRSACKASATCCAGWASRFRPSSDTRRV